MDPDKAPLKARLRYRFDNTIARGSIGLIAWLAAVTGCVVFATAIVVTIVGKALEPTGVKYSFPEAVWQSMLRVIDSGTFAGDTGWGYRVVALLITVCGIFIFSSLIGLITTALDQKLESLRKGRTPVLESQHSLILGWSEKLHTIIGELLLANANQKDACIVVMAPRDKVEMEDEIYDRIEAPLGPTRIVCRTGDPTDPGDLTLVNPTSARSVIVLSPNDDASADAHVVKVVLGLMSFDRELEGIHVIAELTEDRNADALEDATGGKVHTVVSADLIARITAQVCRQTGMSLVYQELLDFDGDEVYFHHEPRLVGVTYGQALLSYERSAVIGIRHPDATVRLNPPMETVLAADDKLVAISEDDDTIVLGEIDGWDPAASPASEPAQPPAPERTLVLGWNSMGPRILAELDNYVAAGSVVDLFVDPQLVLDTGAMVNDTLTNIELAVHEADTSDPEAVAGILDSERYDQLLLLSYRDTMPLSEADARTLLTLVQVRRALRAEDHRNGNLSIVTELLDVRAVRLAQIANPDDFVVSERLTSLLLAQLSENAELEQVFEELMDADGCELNLRPVTRYVPAGTKVRYAELVAAARDRGETAIGFRSPHLAADDGLGGGVVVNPPKGRHFDLHADDQLIVLAE